MKIDITTNNIIIECSLHNIEVVSGQLEYCHTDQGVTYEISGRCVVGGEICCNYWHIFIVMGKND